MSSLLAVLYISIQKRIKSQCLILIMHLFFSKTVCLKFTPSNLIFFAVPSFHSSLPFSCKTCISLHKRPLSTQIGLLWAALDSHLTSLLQPRGGSRELPTNSGINMSILKFQIRKNSNNMIKLNKTLV